MTCTMTKFTLQPHSIGRRRVLHWLSAGFGGLVAPLAEASDILISDTHSHAALSMGPSACFRCVLSDSGTSLVAWTFSADAPFIQRMPNGGIRVITKPNSEQFRDFFWRALGRIQRLIRAENLRVARTAEDVDLALQGQLHIVLSTEGAYYLGGDLNYLDTVYDQGVRQIGLGHFVEGELLDIRTEVPRYGGLTAFGREVIKRCNHLGIVVDLAHATDQAVSQALEVSQQPMIWSHSAITRQPTDWRSGPRHVMSISLANAKAMANRGGLVGIWPSRSNFDNLHAYVAGLAEAVDLIGENHVAFGTDMHGLSPIATMIEKYSELREIVNLLLASNMPEKTVRKVAGENYARLLKTVFRGRSS